MKLTGTKTKEIESSIIKIHKHLKKQKINILFFGYKNKIYIGSANFMFQFELEKEMFKELRLIEEFVSLTNIKTSLPYGITERTYMDFINTVSLIKRNKPQIKGINAKAVSIASLLGEHLLPYGGSDRFIIFDIYPDEYDEIEYCKFIMFNYVG